MTLRSLFVSLMLVAVPLLAQTPPVPAPVDGSRTYVPADFAQFAPQTALDMLNRVPGFAIKQEEDARGLGQAVNGNGAHPGSDMQAASILPRQEEPGGVSRGCARCHSTACCAS